MVITTKNARVGLKVRRGPDWKWDNQDVKNGKQCVGEITDVQYKWARVKWSFGYENSYRIREQFDLVCDRSEKIKYLLNT